MLKTGDFQKFFEPPCNYKTEEILLFSYSLNLVILDEIIRKSKIVAFQLEAGKLNEEFESVSKKVACFVQSDRRSGELKGAKDTDYAYQLFLRGSVKTVLHDNEHQKSFHPKLWAILFSKEGETSDKEYLLRLVISSRNLSKQNMIEGAIFLETDQFGENIRNTDLSKMMEDIGAKATGMVIIDRIEKADFYDCISAIIPEGMELQEYEICTNSHRNSNGDNIGLAGLLPNEYTFFTGISPFLGEEMLSNVLLAGTDKNLLITRKMSFTESIKTVCQEKKCSAYYLHDDIKCEVDDENTDDYTFDADELPLHAKIYGFDCENGNEKNSWLYIGSANFSERGMGANQNYELLLKIKTQYKEQGFAKLLRQDFNNITPIKEINDYGESDFQIGEKFDHGMEKEQVDRELDSGLRRIIDNHIQICDWEILKDVFGITPKSNEMVVDYAFRCIKESSEESICEMIERAETADLEKCSEQVKETIIELRNLRNIIIKLKE